MYRDSARTRTQTLPPPVAVQPLVLTRFPGVVILTTNTTSLHEEETLRELTLQQLFGRLVSEVMYLACYYQRNAEPVHWVCIVKIDGSCMDKG